MPDAKTQSRNEMFFACVFFDYIRKENIMMSKRTRQYIGILFAIVDYKLVKAIFYYVTVIMLVLDPIYLCLLSGAFGGGDVNGILYLMPQAWIWTIFAFI